VPLRRRQFLLRSLAVLGGTAGAPAIASAFLQGGAAPPSERLRLAWIGCGGRGRRLCRIFDAFADVDIAAVCDVNAPRMDQARAELGDTARAQQPEKVADYRRLLDRRDIDAVVIATCEHWHGLPFIDACRAGKHVFVEKPLSHTVREGRLMVRAAAKAGVVALMGTQQRAGTHFQEAVELVRSGRLGKVVDVECWNYHRISRGGRPANSAPPAGLDWERWLGPAPQVPFNPLRLDYSWWFDYGGGMMTNWNVHHADTVLWAMGFTPPERVHCAGGLVATETLSDAPDLIEATWQFPGWTMRYSYKGYSSHHPYPARPHHHGIRFCGTEGLLHLDREGFALYESAGSGTSDKGPEDTSRPAKMAPRSEQDGPWQRHFVDCVKDGKRPAVSLEESHQATVCCLLANIAYHVRRSVRWDGVGEAIADDPPAAALLERPRRAGYELPAV
jgi:predicted dehydrogenase